MHRMVRGAFGCAAALVIGGCGSTHQPPNRSVAEVASCLRARGLLTGVRSSEIGAAVGVERVVPVVAGRAIVAGIYLFPGAAAAERLFDRRVPTGSPAASAFKAGNVALIALAIPAGSPPALGSIAKTTTSAKFCAFGADAARAQAYATAAPTDQLSR